MTEADFSNKHLGESGARILAAWISSTKFKDSGALVSLNICANKIGSEQEANIRHICANKSIKCTV